VAVILGVSSIIPMRNLPETPYDESESMPYESTPLFSVEVLQQLAVVPPAKLKSFLPFDLRSPARLDESEAPEGKRTAYPVFEALTIRYHSLRC
jgi:hypothetical protein